MKRPIKAFLACLLFLAVLPGCTNNPPSIRDVWWIPLTVSDPSREGQGRELMLYVQVDDREGAADLAELRLTRPEKELTWKADTSSWSEWEENGVLWIGCSRFLSPGSELFEEGSYELILEDKGGREDRILLELEGWLGEEDLKEHRIITDDGSSGVLISSSLRSWYLVPAGNGGEKPPLSVPVNETFFPADYSDGTGDSYYLLMFDRSRMAGYRAGPYFFSSVE